MSLQKNKTEFDAILRPHRSLSARQFTILMSLIIILNAGVGLYFASRGAWPVLGFCGLEILILWLAFRSNFLGARAYERVFFEDQQLCVEDYNHKGERTGTWAFHPGWVRINTHEQEENGLAQGHIEITSHGQGVAVGSFLTRAERADFVYSLRRALKSY